MSAPYNSYWPMDFSLGLIREQKRAGVVLVVCLTLTFRVGLIEKPAPVCWVLGPSQLSGESLESAWLVKNVINALLYRWMTCFFLTQMVFSRCYPVGRTADMELDPLKLPPQRTDSKIKQWSGHPIQLREWMWTEERSWIWVYAPDSVLKLTS